MSLTLASVVEQYEKCLELKKEDVLKLMEWIQKQPHLPDINELETIIFLHSNYCNVESTKSHIDLYHTMRTHCPEFFARRDIMGDDIQLAMSTIIIVPLPTLTHDGNRVMYCSLMDCNPSNFIFADCIKLFVFVMDLLLMEKGVAEGIILIVDLTGVQFGHVTKLGIITMKKFLDYLQDAMPVRLKGLHFINIVSFMDKILAIMRPFMKKKLLDMLELHSTLDTISKKVSEDIFPNECGPNCKAGTREELRSKCNNHLKENGDFFKNEEKHRRVTEKLRPGEAKNAGTVFGVDGHFKKLDFD